MAAGANPMVIRQGIQQAVETAVEAIGALSQKIETKEEIAQVAAVSCDDAKIGEMIAEAMTVVGKDGVITVEDSQTFGTTLSVVKGMQFDRGYISPYMVTDTEKMVAVLENPLILLTDKKVSTVQEVLPALEHVMQAGRPLLLIAEDDEGEALTTLLLNKLRGTVACVAVKAPGFGDRRKDMLKDIAVLTGGQVITDDLGYELENTSLYMLGSAVKVTISKDDTIIVEVSGTKQKLIPALTKYV